MCSISMTVYRGMPVRLAEASSGTRPAVSTEVLSVDRDGNFFLGSRPLALDAMTPELTRIARSGVPLVLSADAAARHETVIRALDWARLAGVVEVSLAVQPRPAR